MIYWLLTVVQEQTSCTLTVLTLLLLSTEYWADSCEGADFMHISDFPMVVSRNAELKYSIADCMHSTCTLVFNCCQHKHWAECSIHRFHSIFQAKGSCDMDKLTNQQGAWWCNALQLPSEKMLWNPSIVLQISWDLFQDYSHSAILYSLIIIIHGSTCAHKDHTICILRLSVYKRSKE